MDLTPYEIYEVLLDAANKFLRVGVLCILP